MKIKRRKNEHRKSTNQINNLHSFHNLKEANQPADCDFIISFSSLACWIAHSRVMCLPYIRPVYGETNCDRSFTFL